VAVWVLGFVSNLYVFSSHSPGLVLSGVPRSRVSFVLLANLDVCRAFLNSSHLKDQRPWIHEFLLL